jgi:probable HAF family extracellular repeat protein
MPYTFTTFDDPLGLVSTEVFGINNSRQIVGEYTNVNGQNHGFRYSNGVYTTLNDPNAPNNTVATGINNVGQIVGIFTGNSGHDLGFLYTVATNSYTTLSDPLGAQGTDAWGINDNGQISGADDPSAGTGGGQGTSALGINSLGQIVGVYYDSIGHDVGFFRDTNGGYISLSHPSRADCRTAGSISTHRAGLPTSRLQKTHLT